MLKSPPFLKLQFTLFGSDMDSRSTKEQWLVTDIPKTDREQHFPYFCRGIEA
jgi:hypothetical protein